MQGVKEGEGRAEQYHRDEDTTKTASRVDRGGAGGAERYPSYRQQEGYWATPQPQMTAATPSAATRRVPFSLGV